MRLFRTLAWLLLAPPLVAAAEPAATPDAAAPLGRLFMTPELRATLERQRQLNVPQARGMEGESLRLDGIVTRSSGKSTVWINARPQSEHSRDAAVPARTSRRQPGQATLATPDGGSVDLKVGVTVDPATGERRGGLAAGEIRVRPAGK